MLGALAVIATPAIADSDALQALLGRIDPVAKEVAKLRGLKLKRRLDRDVVDGDELRRRLRAMAEDPQRQSGLRDEGLALARWGLIPLDMDYPELMVELLATAVAGYYDSTTKKLVISQDAAAAPGWAELALAHEIDHALQDQAFGLDKIQTVPATEGDAAVARRALVEGDGLAVMIELTLSRQNLPPPWGDATVASLLDDAMVLPAGDALAAAPLAVREAMLFPARAGLLFVAALREHAPWSAVDRAYRRPPRSTEQILHHDKYTRDEKPVAVSLVAPSVLTEYTVAHSTVWGELGFTLFLRAHGIPADTAAQAAAGWGGDRILTLTRGDDRTPARSIGIAQFAWDSEADAIEAHEATVRALDATLAGATAEQLDTRTRWLALDGTVSLVERRDTSVVIAVGVPVHVATALLDALWAQQPGGSPSQASR